MGIARDLLDKGLVYRNSASVERKPGANEGPARQASQLYVAERGETWLDGGKPRRGKKRSKYFGLRLVVEQRPAGASPAVRDWFVLCATFVSPNQAPAEARKGNHESNE